MKHNEQHINPSPITIASLNLTLWKAQARQNYAPSLCCAEESLYFFLHCQMSTTRLEMKVDQAVLDVAYEFILD